MKGIIVCVWKESASYIIRSEDRYVIFGSFFSLAKEILKICPTFDRKKPLPHPHEYPT